MDILLTGGTGQVGSALLETSLPKGWRLHAPMRHDLDLSDPASVQSALGARAWGAVINSGAYTAVDRAESDSRTAWAVNATAPALIARWAAQAGVPLVHISTDYVYPGDKSGSYTEEDDIGPLGVYGASKAAGELGVMVSGARAFIARTSWVVSPFGANFVKTMLRLGSERSELKIISDQFGAPTSAQDLAVILIAVLARMVGDPLASTGVYHAVNAGETTWFGIAEEVFARAAKNGRTAPVLVPIPTREYPTPARRPLNSRLDSRKLYRDYGISMPGWRPSIASIVDQIINQG